MMSHGLIYHGPNHGECAAVFPNSSTILHVPFSRMSCFSHIPGKSIICNLKIHIKLLDCFVVWAAFDRNVDGRGAPRWPELPNGLQNLQSSVKTIHRRRTWSQDGPTTPQLGAKRTKEVPKITKLSSTARPWTPPKP